MEKNKSIDGLEVRRNKKVVKNSSIDGLTVKKKTIKNPSTMPDFNKKTVAKKPANVKYNFNMAKYGELLDAYVNMLAAEQSPNLQKAVNMRQALKNAYDGNKCLVDGATWGIATAYAKRAMAA